MQDKIDCNKINKIREERNDNSIYTKAGSFTTDLVQVARLKVIQKIVEKFQGLKEIMEKCQRKLHVEEDA